VIPASHISFNNDGTAWYVFSESAKWWADIKDRPCDTCLGTKLRVVSSPDGSEVYHGPGPCPDCNGTGRHTFTIEVAWQTEVDAYESQSYRVSVIPGMVLPIVDGDQCPENPHVAMNPDGTSWHCNGTPYDGDRQAMVTLPPAAKAGMWAVKLKIGT
jgi:hypothetical protein